MLHILAGPDDYSLNQALQEIKRGLGDAAALETCTSVFDGQKVTAEELKNAVDTVPFLSEKRLVIVYGLMGRFEGRPRPERQRSSRPQPEAGPFVRCLSSMPDSTVAVLVENEVPDLAKGRFKDLAGKAEVKLFPVLKEPVLRTWVRERATGLGSGISPAAVDMLVRLVGGNLWVMANEIDKLSAFAGGRRIEAEDVGSLVGYTQDVSVFSMIDAVLDFRAEAATQVLRRLLGQGAAPAYLLFMLDRQFRTIIRAKDMRARGRPEGVIQNRLGLLNDFAFRRTMEQAGRHTLARLKQVYLRLLEADVSMKTGRFDSELVMELLIAELSQRAASGGRTAGTGVAHGT